MKSSNSILGYLALIVLAIALTIASTMYARTAYCDESRYCYPQAGFPLPIVRDQTGDTPTGGDGIINSSDYLDVDTSSFIIDLLFHAALVLFIWTAARVMRGKTKPLALLPIVPLLFLALLSLGSSPISEVEASRTRQYLASINGNWHGTDPSTGAEFTLRFQEPSTILIVQPTFPFGNMGDYSWQGNDTISFLFRWASPFPEDGAGPCTYVPSFLKRDCHYTVVEPSPDRGYPVSPSTTDPVPPPEAYPFPAPPSEPSEYVRGLRSELSASFDIKIDGDTMTLTHESGTVQTLHR
ncbi:MAG TPA: hypothetical protein VF707_17170 [Ardenticatenaceae bacterium]|jgi:hypothetical protein